MRSGRSAAAMLLALTLVLAGCGRPADPDAVRADEGPAAAATRLGARLAEKGDAASPRLRVNHAWALLRTGADAEAEATLRALSRLPQGDLSDEVRALAAFLRGNVAFTKAVAAGKDVSKPDADARARSIALRHGEDALAAWQVAAASRADWPEAQRNVERALRWVRALRERSARRRQQPRPNPTQPNPEEQPEGAPQNDGAKPPPPTPRNPEDLANERPTAATPRTLTPEEVLGLLDRLQALEKEKRGVRQTTRKTQSASVEKDW